MSGTNFVTYVVPSLVTAVHYALALVPDPTPGQQRTLFDEAVEHEQSIDPSATEPIYFNLGSGSDFTPFFQHLGLPSADFAFHGPHGVYHSIYDSYTHMAKFGDPGFLRGPALARFLSVLTLSLSDAQILPFRYIEYV